MWVMQWSTPSLTSSWLEQGPGLGRSLPWKSGPWRHEGTCLGDLGDVDQICASLMDCFIQGWDLDTRRMQRLTPTSSPNCSPWKVSPSTLLLLETGQWTVWGSCFWRRLGMQVLHVVENWIKIHNLRHISTVEYCTVINRNKGDDTCC